MRKIFIMSYNVRSDSKNKCIYNNHLFIVLIFGPISFWPMIESSGFPIIDGTCGFF